jgi:superkiller protein 3
MCKWNIDSTRSARKDRKGPYAHFLSALKLNLNFAPAYTILGIYYSDYAKDRKRARKCFQKAIELSASEVEAAQRLARAFADQGEWNLVDAVAQRVVDSGKVRPAPGSTKTGISWPFAALGVVQLNNQDYAKSIASFQAAIRISPMDYHSWVGLGESYHNSGRHIAATKAFQQAEKLESMIEERKEGESWFAKYMLANVMKELGDYDDAVERYQEVLRLRPKEFGVSIALVQTLIENARYKLDRGLFGGAVSSAKAAIESALHIAADRSNAFNLWKAVGDACSVYSWVQSHVDGFPHSVVKELLKMDIDMQSYDIFAEFDGVDGKVIDKLGQHDGAADATLLTECLHAGILALKRGVYSSLNDVYAQAVAYYNLGWMEHRAHACLVSESGQKSRKWSSGHLKASLRCFKRAIELEAGNADFWNALGVVTSTMNPKVAQHSFVRSLFLNDKVGHISQSRAGTLGLQ